MPHAILGTTSTIWELKYGEKPSIRVHFKDVRGVTPEPRYKELDDSSVTCKEKIERFLASKFEREKGSPYKKIELFWRHPLLKVTSLVRSLVSIILTVFFFFQKEYWHYLVCIQFGNDEDRILDKGIANAHHFSAKNSGSPFRTKWHMAKGS